MKKKKLDISIFIFLLIVISILVYSFGIHEIKNAYNNISTEKTNYKLNLIEKDRIKPIEINFNKKTSRHFLILGELIKEAKIEKYNDLNKWKETKIKYNDNIYQAKIKVHGVLPDQHSYGFFIHSYSVKLKKGDLINGSRKFKLIVNGRLKNAISTIFNAKKYNIFVQQLYPVKVTFNKIFQSEYSFSPKIDDVLAEQSGRGSYILLKEVLKKNEYNENDLKSFLFNPEEYSLFKSEDFHSLELKLKESLKKYKFSAKLKNEIIQRHAKLNRSIYYKNFNEALEYFDLEYISNYLLSLILTAESGHQNIFGNQHVAYDLATGYFYPLITHDSGSLPSKFLKNKTNIFSNLSIYSDATKIPLISYLLNNNQIKLNLLKKIDYSLKNENMIFLQYIDNPNLRLDFLNYHDLLKQEVEKNYFKISKNKMLTDKNFNELKEFGIFKKDEFIFNKGNHKIVKDLIFPHLRKVIINEETTLTLDPNISIIIFGSINIIGSKESNIEIKSSNPDNPFGVFAAIGNASHDIKIKYLKIENASATIKNGRVLSGGLSLYNFNKIEIENLFIKNSSGEDALNIKYAKYCNLKNINIFNSKFDAIDIDDCNTIAKNLKINNLSNQDGSGDGIDFYHSEGKVYDSEICGFRDKGISIGEGSAILLNNNKFCSNKIGVAVKDSSCAKIEANSFKDNEDDISVYRKKNNFMSGTLYMNVSKKNLKIKTDKLALILDSKLNFHCNKKQV